MGNSKDTSHSTSSFNQTVTPTNPQWVETGMANFGKTLANLQNLTPYSLVSGPNPLQTLAGQGAASLTAATPTIYDGGGKAPSVLDHLSSYQDPYTQQVVRSTLGNYDYAAGQQQAANKLSLANLDGTFGGSGGAIQSALMNSQILRDRAQTQSGLLDQGYKTALGAATTDAQLRDSARNRALQSSIAQAQLIQNAEASQRANIATQSALGDDQRQIEQQQRLAPITTASALASLWGALPLGLLHGENSSGTQTADSETVHDPGLMAKIAQGIGIASSLLGMMPGGGAGGSVTPMEVQSLPTITPMTLFNGPLKPIAWE